MPCSDCVRWCTAEKRVYSDGAEFFDYQAPTGMGKCVELGIETKASFGCQAHVEEFGTHEKVDQRKGLAWQFSKAGPCPDCQGVGNPDSGKPVVGDGPVPSRPCDRCVGTGKVRYYEDGYIGEERTRLHPKERELMQKPKCLGCQREVDRDWMMCPSCGTKLDAPAKTEVVGGLAGGMI